MCLLTPYPVHSFALFCPLSTRQRQRTTQVLERNFQGLLTRKLYRLLSTISRYVQVYYCYFDILHWNELCLLYTYTHIHIVIKQYYKLCVRTGVDALKYLFHCHYRYISYLYFRETRKNESNLLVLDDYMFQMVLNLTCLQYQIKETGLDKACVFIYVLHRPRLQYKQSSFKGAFPKNLVYTQAIIVMHNYFANRQ